MTLEEAMVVLDTKVRGVCARPKSIQREAIKLGIEAMKQIKDCRADGGLFGVPLLPGETEK